MYAIDSWDDLKSHSCFHLVGCDDMNDILFQNTVQEMEAAGSSKT